MGEIPLDKCSLGTMGMAESGIALVSREKIKEVRACVIFIFEESLD